MSYSATAMPATTWQTKANPRWYYKRETPRLTSEGDEVVLSFSCLNWNVGSCIAPWMTGGRSLASSGNWVKSWHAAFQEACEANGCTYRQLSSSTTPQSPGGTLAGLITIGPGYRGQTIYVHNRSRRNRRTDATNPDGTPGFREMQILMSAQGASGSPERAFNGTLAPFVGGNRVQVLDTSRRPEGTPTYRLELLAPDGSPSPTNLFAGDYIRVRMKTENMVPLTKSKIYAADTAQKDISPSIQTGLERACAFSKCAVYIPNFNKVGAAGYYRGGEVTFTEDYDDANPVDMLFRLDTPADQSGTLTLVFIAQITFEGDASEFDSIRSRGDWVANASYRRGDWVVYLQDGGTYIYTDETASIGAVPTSEDKWRPYRRIQTSSMALSVDIKPAPPRFWELRATTDGSTITYNFQGPTGAIGDAVDFSSIGAPAGFDAAMASACGPDAPIQFVDGRLVAQATDRLISSVEFTVPHTGAGKHRLAISNPTGASPIVIGDACVFLTPAVRPYYPAKLIGVNLAGGEFDSDDSPGLYGTDYAYPSRPEQPEGLQHLEIDYHVDRGANIIRIPVRWERIVEALGGELYGGGGTGAWNGRQDMRRIDELVDYITNVRGVYAMIDIHNYMAFKPIGRVGYDKPVPTAALVDVNVRLADRYETNTKFLLDTMNEPSGEGATPVRTSDNQQWIVNAVRSRTNFVGKLVLEGASFSSSRNWVSNGQAAAFDRLYDPANNIAFSPHSYPDADASGTDATGACVAGAQNRLDPPLTWGAAGDREILFGEIAGSGLDPVCQFVIPASYQKMADHPNCIGWTTWGGGRRWGASYAYRLDPINYQTGDDTPQMKMLLPFLGGTS